MGYMVVETHTSEILHLRRSPGIRSWSILVGIASIGLAAAYYSSGKKCFLDEAVFDKSKHQIELKTFSLYTLLLTLWKRGHERVVLDLRDLRDISVQEEKVRYLGKGFLLVLRLATGFSYTLTQSATLGSRSDVEAFAALLKRFLNLDELQHNQADDDFLDEDDIEDLGFGDSSDSNEEL
ncbi:hypothetical protein DNTS_010212 [Danionella cerebrum]|uniref:Essential for reactive oxygen species protein n=1 Tax=Danionella cerebrum TaxID=2873325 RepID=A0A553QB35_9TELE|nr:hypothetical protein DNTS_010212 [Danionella translucida]